MHKRTDARMQWGVRIPMRDGGQLSAILYLPEQPARAAPTIFTMTPYVAQSQHEHAMYFAAHGFPFLCVDVRGRGNSEGTFHPLNEAQDGHDIVEWLARQSYCNGKVAMWGLSYMGYCQWATASQSPAHLSTIVPVAAPYRGVDSPLRNNVFTTFSMQWLTTVSGRTSQEKIFADRSFWNRTFEAWFETGISFARLDTFVGNPSSLFQEWISHPHRDEYWDAHNPTAEQYAALTVPVLTITGAYDGDQLGSLAHYRQHLANATAASRDRHYLVIGPWDHPGTRSPKLEFCGLKVGPASLLDLPRLHLEWYAWTMSEGPRPNFLQQRVAYYVTGSEEWRYANSLEEVTARSEPYFLQSTTNACDIFGSGALRRETSVASTPDHYVYDPRDVSHAELESTVDIDSLVDQRLLHACVGRYVVYHSAPFTADIELSGFFRLAAWIAIDQPDTDLRATVHEIGIDCSSLQLSADWIRARYRESPRSPKLVDTREPLLYDFQNFTFVARRIRKGHRLRLVIGPINSLYWQKNYNSGLDVSEETMEDARAVTVSVYHDETRPSALYVPYGRAETI